MDNKQNHSEIIFYEDDDNNLRIKTVVEDETVWLSQQQLAELYQTSKQLVSYHLNNIFKEGELDKTSTVKEFLTVEERLGS